LSSRSALSVSEVATQICGIGGRGPGFTAKGFGGISLILRNENRKRKNSWFAANYNSEQCNIHFTKTNEYAGFFRR
jgi:hypothetical protein